MKANENTGMTLFNHTVLSVDSKFLSPWEVKKKKKIPYDYDSLERFARFF